MSSRDEGAGWSARRPAATPCPSTVTRPPRRARHESAPAASPRRRCCSTIATAVCAESPSALVRSPAPVARRRQLFPTDHGLTLRMVVAAVATPLVVVAAVALVVLVAPLKLIIGLALASIIGVVIAVRERAAAAGWVEVPPTSSPSCTRSSSGCAWSPTCRSRRSRSTTSSTRTAGSSASAVAARACTSRRPARPARRAPARGGHRARARARRPPRRHRHDGRRRPGRVLLGGGARGARSACSRSTRRVLALAIGWSRASARWPSRATASSPPTPVRWR